MCKFLRHDSVNSFFFFFFILQDNFEEQIEIPDEGTYYDQDYVEQESTDVSPFQFKPH